MNVFEIIASMIWYQKSNITFYILWGYHYPVADLEGGQGARPPPPPFRPKLTLYII